MDFPFVFSNSGLLEKSQVSLSLVEGSFATIKHKDFGQYLLYNLYAFVSSIFFYQV